MKRFQRGQPLVDQVTAERLNEIIDGLDARTPLRGKGTRLTKLSRGFLYSAKPGGRSQTIKLGLTVKRRTSSSVTVTPGIVSGCSVVANMPKIDGTALDDATPPQLGITPAAVQYICLKITVVPESTLLEDGATYGIRDGAGLVTGDITVEAYDDTDAMEAASVRAAVDSETGDVTANGVFLVPIGHIAANGTITNVGYYYGPLGIKLCSSGTLQVQGPVIAVATLE